MHPYQSNFFVVVASLAKKIQSNLLEITPTHAFAI